MRFKAKKADCVRCHLKGECLSAKATSRRVRIGHGYDALLRARRRKAKGWGTRENELYRRHKFRVEGIHGEAKECHGLRRAVRRGRWNMGIQAYLAAAAINLKRLASFLRGVLAQMRRQRGHGVVTGDSGKSFLTICRFFHSPIAAA